jgi:oligopeptide/dipeptide ABC transporter ATP-binding protein
MLQKQALFKGCCMGNLLEIHDLNVSFKVDRNIIDVLTGVNLKIESGEIVALVGESGSGKTTTAMMIMGLLRMYPNLIKSGRIDFQGKDLIRLPERDMHHLRGGSIGMVFQEPLSALNPAMSVGEQIEETLMLHGWKDRAQRRKRVLEVMREVGLPNPEAVYTMLPRQLSGGMKQRVVIAMAVSCRPDLIIADEPTTALDVTTQAQILSLLRKLKKEYNLSVILITHDLGVVAEMADKVAVMYGGLVLEQAPVREIFSRPSHPYTAGLMKCIPYVGRKIDKLYAIPGSVPHASRSMSGCIFYPRCDIKSEGCNTSRPELYEISESHTSRCMRWKEFCNE